MNMPKCHYCKHKMEFGPGRAPNRSFVCPNCLAELKQRPDASESMWLSPQVTFEAVLDRNCSPSGEF